MHIVRLLLAFFFPVLILSAAGAQNGFIRGTVYDGQTADPLPGVTVFLAGTTIGTMTDFDGKFSFSAPAGTYDLRISFISYETLNIQGVKISADEVTLFDNIRLNETIFELEEIVVSAKMIKRTEEALLMIKQNSANLIDGISAAKFRKIGDSDAAAAMKRITGASVEDGKYVYIRGLGDRYTKTTLNGMEIPGLDPDRNTLQMDIFPTNIIDNIIVYKTFTANLPADFTGGVIDITTKDFPEHQTANVSVSAAYNPDMHFNSKFLTYEGGKTDWLGFDDGTRRIPAVDNIPFFADIIANPHGDKGQRFREILGNFNPSLAAMQQKSFMDFSLATSLGNQISTDKFVLGYNAALSYKSNTRFYTEVEYGNYGLPGDPDKYEMELREFTFGDFGTRNLLIAGIGGLAIKTEKSKYRLNILHIQNGESKAGIFDYIGTDQGSVFDAFQHNLEYSQRGISNILLNGKHFFADNDWEFEWKLSGTRSRIEDPDIRFTRYETRDELFSIGTESGFPERIWRNLMEDNLAGSAIITREFKWMGANGEIQFGGAYIYKERDYIIRNFALNIRGVSLTGDPNELMFEENLWPLNGNIGRGTTYEAPFIPENPNQYNSRNQNTAGFVSLKLRPFSPLKVILGVRAESFSQHYTGRDQLGQNVLNDDEVLKGLDFFPTANIIYSLRENQNLRLSYSKTIARPSFKELSFAEIYDPISGRTFVGGMFRDADNVAGIEYWDGNLVSTSIRNFDLRWELFQARGQTISLGAFYKDFKRPIEMVQFHTQKGAFQPRNVGDGTVFGAEFELRKNLDFISNSLQFFSLSSNVTFTRSKIRLSATELKSRQDNARTGEKVGDYRDMAGQAPYIINAGLVYNGGNQGFLKGLEAGLYYNVQGSTLLYVGIADRPDVYVLAFHSLNFNANKSFGSNGRARIGLKMVNILNANREAVFVSYKARNQYFSRLVPGTKATISFSYNIF